MSVFALLPVVFNKNVFVFLDQVVFSKNVLSHFIKSYLNVRTLKYTHKNIFMQKYDNTAGASTSQGGKILRLVKRWDSKR